MRSHGGELSDTETEAWFVDDLLDGGLTVQCDSCAAYTDLNGAPKPVEYCSNCSKEFIYRPWWSW